MEEKIPTSLNLNDIIVIKQFMDKCIRSNFFEPEENLTSFIVQDKFNTTMENILKNNPENNLIPMDLLIVRGFLERGIQKGFFFEEELISIVPLIKKCDEVIEMFKKKELLKEKLPF